MAELGKHKDKNDDRLKKLQALKAAQALPMPDPMIGYGQDAQARKGTLDADPAPITPAKEDSQPQPQPLAEVQPVQEPADDASDTASVEADTSAAPENHAPDREVESKAERPSSAGRARQQVKEEVMSIKLTYRFAEADCKRAEAIAQDLGVTPEVILLKAVQTVVLEDGDFKDGNEKRRVGPIVRRELKVPKKKAEAWIAAQDPLGVIPRPGDVLRQVAYNALDRAAEKLLPQLEAKKRNVS